MTYKISKEGLLVQKDVVNMSGTNSTSESAIKKVLMEDVNLSISDIKDRDLT